MLYLKLIAGLFIAWLLGDMILGVFAASGKMRPPEKLALGYLIGQGALTLLLFFLFLLPISHRVMLVSWLVLALFGLKLLVKRKCECLDFAAFLTGCVQFMKKMKAGPYALLLIILFSGLTFKLSYVFVESCSKPEYAWDAAGNWTDAGKNYFYAEKYRPDRLVEQFKKAVNGYPRSLSIMHYWLFGWMGEANDQWSKIIFPLELLCLLVIFYYGLEPVRGRLGALAFTYFLCSAPLFLYHATIGYADLTKTVYFSAGMIYFFAGRRKNRGMPSGCLRCCLP
jgi:hypothetical protein